jgi:hypothetical protein
LPEAAGFCFLEFALGVLPAADFALALPPPLPLIVFSSGKIENCGKVYILNRFGHLPELKVSYSWQQHQISAAA